MARSRPWNQNQKTCFPVF